MNFFLVPLRKYDLNYGLRKTYQNFFKRLDITLLGVAPDIDIIKSLDISHFDGLLLPGGGDINPQEYGKDMIVDYDLDIDESEKMLYNAFIRQKKPIIGICRGLQVINVFQGGSLKNIQNHMNKEHLLKYKGRKLTVNSHHHQAVDHLGQDIITVAYSPDGQVEIITSKQLKMLAFQFHPELMEEDEQSFWSNEIKNYLN